MRAILVVAAGLGIAAAPPRDGLSPEQAAARKKNVVLFTDSLFAWQGGKQAEAMALLRELLERETRILGRCHLDIAEVVDRFGDWHQAREEWAEEARWRREYVETVARLRGPSHWRVMEGRQKLADALDQAKRAPAQRDALKKAAALNARAMALYRAGEFAKALPLFQQALALRKETLGERHPLYASSLNNLGMLRQDMGDTKAALPLLTQALAIKKATLGLGHPGFALSANNLARLLRDAGDHAAALPLMKQAMEAWRESLGEGPDYAIGLLDFAKLMRARGLLDGAAIATRRAMSIIEETQGKRHPRYAAALSELSSILHRTDGPKAALPLARQALAIRQEALGKRHADYAASLSDVAGLLRELGDDKAALPLIDESLSLSLARLEEYADVLSERQQLDAARTARIHLDNRLLLHDPPGLVPAAARVLAWKGQALVRHQQRRLFLRLESDPEAKAAAAEVRGLARRLALLRESASGRRNAEAVQERLDAAQAALADRSAAYRAARARPTPDDLAASLPADAVLIDYHLAGQRLLAFVHRRGKSPVRFDLDHHSAIRAAVLAWRGKLLAGEAGHDLAAKVKALVWSPLEKQAEGAKLVLVSPDGPLGLIPFAALPGKKAGTYLVEDAALAVVPVPASLPGLARPAEEGSADSLLVVGGVDYGSPVPAGATRKWNDLPGTEAEAEAVRASFKGRFGKEAIRLRGGKATAAAVRERLPHAKYAHLATHGWFLPEKESWRHPLLLSGLAFAGANRPEEDGLLTALEVSEMDLTRMELAVLSACETGLGKLAAGEGLLGMQRAFAAAGARSVIASLWQVDDEATKNLLGDFYTQLWAKGPVSKAEALRKAQLAMLFRKTLDGKPRGPGKRPEKLPVGVGERTDPYHWAAFVLSGDWR